MDLETRPRIYKSCLIRVGGYQDEHEEEVEEEVEELEDVEEAEEDEEEEEPAEEPAKDAIGSLNPSFWELPLEEGAAEPDEKGATEKPGGDSTVKAKAKKFEKRVPVRVSQVINNGGSAAGSAIAKKKTAATYGRRKNGHFNAARAHAQRSPRYVQKQIDAVVPPLPEEIEEVEEEEEEPPAPAPLPPQMQPFPVTRLREQLSEVQVARSSPNVEAPAEAPTPTPQQCQQDVACVLSSSAVAEERSDEATKIEDQDMDHDDDDRHYHDDFEGKQASSHPEKEATTLVFPAASSVHDPIQNVLSRIVHETEARVAAMERQLDAEQEAVQRDVQLHYEQLKTDARADIAREIGQRLLRHSHGSSGLRQPPGGSGGAAVPRTPGARVRAWPMGDEYYGIIPPEASGAGHAR